MWWMWPQLRRFWTATGAVAVGIVATWLYNLLSDQALPHSRVALQTLEDYWPWLIAVLLGLTTLSVAAERAHRRHAGQSVHALSDYLPLSFRSERGAGRAQRGIPELFSPWAVTGVVLLLVAIYAIARWRGSNASDQAAAQTHPIRSIAVLPLDNYSGDPKQEYFAEGMFLKMDRIFDPLRQEPRFIALLKKVHLDN